MTTLAPPPAVAATLPAAAHFLIHAALETMTGRRSLRQLRPHLSERARIRLTRYATGGAYRQLVVGRLRTQMPTPKAVEATVMLQRDQRWISCAIRLDAEPSGWVCTDFTVLTPSAA